MLAKFGLSGKSFGAHLRVMTAFSVVVNLLVLVPSIHMLQVYDRVLASNSVSTLVYLTLIVCFLLMIYGAAESIRSHVAVRLAASYSVAKAGLVFADITGGETSQNRRASVMRDFMTARSFLAGKAFVGLFDLPFIPLYVMIMFLLHWSLGLFILLAIALMLVLSLSNAQSTEQERIEGRKLENDTANYSHTIASMQEEMRTFGTADHFRSIWTGKLANSLISAEDSGAKSAHYHGLSKSARQILQVLVMALGGYLAVTGKMSAGMIFMASMVAGKALSPIDQLTGGWEQISKGIEALRALEAIDPVRDAGQAMRVPQVKGFLDIKGISWIPDTSKPEREVLTELSLQIRPGEAIVITGSTGAGKSTLMRIISGAIAPSKGRVTLDGLDAKAWPSGQWSNLIGYMPQEIVFFPGTIAANIARFEPQAKGEAIVKVATAAGAHEMIMRLPEGYSTKIGPDGVGLSSGQKQQIALARALYPSPKILILDEPNAHLDAEGEAAMMRALFAAKRDGAGIVITAHRNTVLKIADRVFILKSGRLNPFEPTQTVRTEGQEPTGLERQRLPAFSHQPHEAVA